MAHLKAKSALLLLLAHGCLCQQQSTYSAPSQTKLEDIERDNLKSAQSQTSSVPGQTQVPSQYLQYPTQDQSLYNLVAAQQSVPALTAGSQPVATPGIGQQLYSVPNQQSVAALFAAQQQPIFYFNPAQAQQPQQQQQQAVFDLSNFFQGGYPFAVAQQGNNAAGVVLPADFYKNYQAAVAQTKVPATATATPIPGAAAAAVAAVPAQALKNVPGYQFGANYFVPAASPQSAYYQPVSFQPSQNAAQYYYNSLYQLQSPQKSVYAAGVKSTTPATLVKGKEEQQFVPIGNSNYRLEYSTADQLSNYGKVRLSG